MAPRARIDSMKQQSLRFSSRRSTATSNAKARKASESPATVPSTPAVDVPKAADISDAEEPEEADVDVVVKRKGRTSKAKAKVVEDEDWVEPSKKRKRQDVQDSSTSKGKGKGKQRATRGTKVFNSRASLENTEDVQASPRRESESSDVEVLAELDTSEKAKKQRVLRHYGEVREKMGHLEAIHAKGQTKEHHILRVFDLSYEYGPCVGMTRLQRWERAEALGLKPPIAVKEILLAEQAKEESGLLESVFFDEV